MNIIIAFLSVICLFGSAANSFKISLVKPPSIVSSTIFYKKLQNPYGKKYYEELIKEKEKENYKYARIHNRGLKKYPISQVYYEQQLSRLNSNNNTIRDNELLADYLQGINAENEEYYNLSNATYQQQSLPQLRIRINKQNIFDAFGIQLNFNQNEEEDVDNPNMQQNKNNYKNKNNKKDKKTKSDNFEVVDTYNLKFKDVGGYNNVKEELRQCVDLLRNFTKYSKYNVRVPKGLILEGPPGTGKTLLSKALAGEAGCGFIAVAGSDFQEKYVGVGSTRIKELFKLASENAPCIIFIDEIDALGRKRSSDGETSSSERDATLNALLVELDGFKNNTGIFLVSATNRIDLLDAALTRPGRIDKKIFIGLPDKETRNAILNIHIKGKPHDNSIKKYELVEMTEGLTGAQIENLLNEAMLNALRSNREMFTIKDFDLVFNKMIVGWQPNEHKFTTDIIDHIAIHEMGHAIVGILSKHHSKMTKVVINFSSPRSPGYTVFETSTSNIYTRESLFEHLMILLAGRIAEEIFYGTSVTTGAINDFEEALKLSEKMVIYYGMGTNVIYPSSSDKYKEMIDNDVIELINKAYEYAETILKKSTSLIKETSDILKKEKFLTSDNLVNLINTKYPELNNLKIEFTDDAEE